MFAGTLLTFIPATGDYINAEILGSPQTRMIGNVIQSKFLIFNDYPAASALSFTLMAIMLVLIADLRQAARHRGGDHRLMADRRPATVATDAAEPAGARASRPAGSGARCAGTR